MAQSLPTSESLKMTVERVARHWQEQVLPAAAAGRKVLLIGHGNSLRALVKHLDQVPD